MEDSEIRIGKGTQKFVKELSELPKDKYLKTKDLLETLGKQQENEAQLENKRGWRYMWQRTPKPFLVMMGYFVGFGSIGSFGYANYSKAIGFEQLYLFSLMIIMVTPLILVGVLTYFYIKGENKKNRENNED
jgi:hypothetical protein